MVGIYPLNSIAVVGGRRIQPGLVLLVVKFYHYAPDRALLEVSSHSFQDKKFCSFNVNLYQVNATTVQIVEPSLDDLDRWSVFGQFYRYWDLVRTCNLPGKGDCLNRSCY